METCKMEYAVLVGNMGIAHIGPSKKKAIAIARRYKVMLEESYGRASGEEVYVYSEPGDDAVWSYIPKRQSKE
jgi:hypothetical protein